MSMTPQNTKVDAFVSRARKWQGLIRKLRSILLECGLDEDLKWGKPCFMFEGKNVAIIQPFKQHCSLMFFNGTLLQAPGATAGLCSPLCGCKAIEDAHRADREMYLEYPCRQGHERLLALDAISTQGVRGGRQGRRDDLAASVMRALCARQP